MHEPTHTRRAAQILAAGTIPSLQNADVESVDDLAPLIIAPNVELDLCDHLDRVQLDAVERFSVVIDRARSRHAMLTNTAQTTLARQFRDAVEREARCTPVVTMLDEALAVVRDAEVGLRISTDFEDGVGVDWDIRTVRISMSSARVAAAA